MLIYLSNQLVSLSTGVHSVESTRFCLDKQIVAFNAFEWKGGCELEDHLEQSAILIEDLWIYRLSKLRACEWHCKCLPDALKPIALLHQPFCWQSRSVCGQEAWEDRPRRIGQLGSFSFWNEFDKPEEIEQPVLTLANGRGNGILVLGHWTAQSVELKRLRKKALLPGQFRQCVLVSAK